jgi:hypothetical protein
MDKSYHNGPQERRDDLAKQNASGIMIWKIFSDANDVNSLHNAIFRVEYPAQ